jgi:hypothetical protein
MEQRVLLERIVIQLSRNSPHFMKTGGEKMWTGFIPIGTSGGLF